MSLYLERFGVSYAVSTLLPCGAASQNVRPDTIVPSMIRLPGGGTFNPWGPDEALPQGTILMARGSYTAATRAALLTKVDELRYRNGTWSNLYISTADGAYRWRKARMWCDEEPVTPHQIGGFWQPMSMTFELGDTIWHGAANSDTITLDASPKEGEINNAGTGLVRDIVITITANDTAITVVHVENLETAHKSNIYYTGTIAIDTALVIDCGAKTVKNAGADAFSGFAIHAVHTTTEWLRLMSGNNTIRVTRTGGAATATANFVFDDAHK